MRKLRYGLRQHDLVVKALEGIRLRVAQRRRARDAEYWGAVREGGAETGKAVAEARIRCDEAYAGGVVALDLGPAFGGLDGDSLVPHVYELDVGFDGGDEKAVQVTA